MSAARDRNREAMPAVAEAVDWLRAHLNPELQVTFAHDETTGESVGTPPKERGGGGHQVAVREPVQCLGCRYRVPDPINPPAGIGRCEISEAARFPRELHHCDQREEGRK
jgi:hypothetical protein